jgi:hypothetical protein
MPKRADKTTEQDQVWRTHVSPKLLEKAHKVQAIIAAPTGRLLISTDLSSAEPRYVAQRMQDSLIDRGNSLTSVKQEQWEKAKKKYPKLFKWRKGMPNQKGGASSTNRISRFRI